MRGVKNFGFRDKKTKFLHISILFLLLIIVGCQKDDKNDADEVKTPDSPPKQEAIVEKEKEEQEEKAEESIFPIQVENGIFQTVSGWVDDEHILYISEGSNGTNVYSHNIKSGRDSLLFESESPIVSVVISPLKEFFLVHSSPSTNEALINVLKLNGESVAEESIPSTELNIEWNPFDDSSILITSFTEDWDFSIWQMDLNQFSLTEVVMPQPFGYWLSKEELLYLDWNMEEPSLDANVKQFHLDTEESMDVLTNIFHIDSFGEVFMSIGADEKNARYTFYHDTSEIFSFEAPHLARYSDWLVPYYDYNVKTNTFLTYQPLHSTEVDAYQEGFQLVSYQLDNGQKDVVVEGMENTPLSCSPDGQYCLSGYYLENLIDMDSKKIIPLVNEKKD